MPGTEHRLAPLADLSQCDEKFSTRPKGGCIDMARISALVKRHRLTAFFILAYALSWWAWIPYALGVFPNPVASFGPFLAALVVLALTEGKAGLLGLFRRMIRWRVAPGWYAVALLLPAVLIAVAT